MTKSLLEMAADIVKSQCQGSAMSTEEITAALGNTFNALQSLQAMESRGEASEAVVATETVAVKVKPGKSILKNKIICLECGESFKTLSPKHLRSHGLDGRSYRQKYGLPLRQPLCAKSLSEKRKEAGKARGLPENLRKVIDAKKAGSVKKSAGRPRKKA